MKKNIKKPLAVAAIASVLAVGGGSYALWSDSADVNGGKITSGLLDVKEVSTQAQDVSPDRVDSPHVINDLTTWKAVPGDVVKLTTNLDIALKGDNLVAQLDAKNVADAIPEAAKPYVTVTADIYDADGTTKLSNPVLLQAPGTGQDAGKDDDSVKITGDSLDGTTDAQAVYTVTFSKDTPDQVLTNVDLANIADAGADLKQVRTGTSNFK